MPSPPKSPPGVRRVRKRLADGTVKVYEYHGPPKSRAKPAAMPADSLRELIAAYQRSPEWQALAERSQRNYTGSLRHIDGIKHLPVTGLKRRDVLELRDAIAAGIGPGAANAFIASFAAMLAWARDRGWIEYSPADRIKAIPGGHLPTWTEDEFAAVMEHASPAVRRALILAVHTGQRRGDLITARWPDMAGGVWKVTQEKTGTKLAVPLHPDLIAEMGTWNREAVTVLANERGRPWRRDMLSMAVKRAAEKAGLGGLNIHGLRKLAAVRLAEAGCSVHEIAAITGHASLSQVALYTKEADQGRLAKAAILRLQTNRPKTG